MESCGAWPVLVSVLAREAEEAWGGGKRTGMLPLLFSVGANQLLQRTLVSSWEVSQFALFDPEPKVVLGFK